MKQGMGTPRPPGFPPEGLPAVLTDSPAQAAIPFTCVNYISNYIFGAMGRQDFRAAMGYPHLSHYFPAAAAGNVNVKRIPLLI